MRIAIADDHPDTRDFVTRTLQKEQYLCSPFRNAPELISALKRETFDLVVIDWKGPEQNGTDVISWARNNLEPCPPIIVMTDRSDSMNIVAALDAGATDYIVKPETPSVITARIRSALRRASPQKSSGRFEMRGNFKFDRSTSTVINGDEVVSLTSKEFALAELFFENGHRPLSRNYILQKVWNSTAGVTSRTLDVHVSRVRAKLGLKPENGFSLRSVFGYGYRFKQLDTKQ